MPNLDDRVKRFESICHAMVRTYEMKNHDYGNSFEETVNNFGIVAAVVRMHDKMNRIISLTTGNEQKVDNESVEDTLMDLATYSIMTLMALKNERN